MIVDYALIYLDNKGEVVGWISGSGGEGETPQHNRTRKGTTVDDNLKTVQASELPKKLEWGNLIPQKCVGGQA